MKAIITVGASSSGKTTFAESLDGSWVNVNRDDLRFSITGCRDWSEYKFNKDVERMVSEVQLAMVKSASEVGKNVIVSDTNLNPIRRGELFILLKRFGYEVEKKYFDADFDTPLKRNQFREKSVPYEVLLDQYVRFRQQTGIKPYTPPEGVPRSTYIFDIDGTLVEKGDRNPFDISKVHLDKPIPHAIDLCVSLWESGHNIIFLSGRNAYASEATRKWLEEHLGSWVYDSLLLMRPDGDCRKDYIVKMELFDKYIRNSYNVTAVVDDRKQVIEQCWCVLGIPVISVGDWKERF